MTTADRVAIVGLDGLDMRDIEQHGDPDRWDCLPIETTAHTVPSWNAIFCGRELPRVFDVWKTPREYERGELAAQSDKRFTYAEIRRRAQHQHVWDRDGVDVDVVSAPVVIPTYSTIDRDLETAIGWPSTLAEVDHAIEILSAETFSRDRVITVFPIPDKSNHLSTSPDKPDFTRADRERHVQRALAIAERVRAEFDEWVILSDHGLPGPAEEVKDDLFVASHDPVGVIQTNAFDATGRTNTQLASEFEAMLS